MFRLDQPIIITIDGPAGTGKSSVSRQLAANLGLDFLDTGAMYRAAAAISLDRKLALTDHEAILAAVTDAHIGFDWSLDPPALLVFEEVMGDRIRSAEVTAIVSAIAGIRELRELMVTRQRAIALKHPRLVTEGRDQGSVVFPDAKVKFYLDASPAVRAERRAKQLAELGQSVDIAALREEIIARDKSDMGRLDGPLVRPEGSILVDTSDKTREQVIAELETHVRALAAKPA
ncbi:MAG: (d)CMP kinase [Phycisphaerales bacterium]